MAGVWRVVHKPRVAVRREPGATSQIVGVQNHGAILHPAEAQGLWLRLEGEVPGWILTDGSQIGLGPLLERLDSKPLRLHARHPATGARALEIELPGNSLVSDARQELARLGLQPAAVHPCRPGSGSALAAEDGLTLYEAGYRDGDEFVFVYTGDLGNEEATEGPGRLVSEAAATTSGDGARVEAAEAPAEAAEALRRLRAGEGQWADVEAAHAGGWPRHAVEALLQAFASAAAAAPAPAPAGGGRGPPPSLLFEWAAAPALGRVAWHPGGRDVALLFGWGGSSNEQLEGPRRWWSERGWTTAVTTRSPRGYEAQVAELVERLQVHEEEKGPGLVVVHAFSNMGSYLLADLRRRWRGPLAGVVLDSAPDPAFDEALLRQVANGCIRSLCALHGAKLSAAADDALMSLNFSRALQAGDRTVWDAHAHAALVYGPPADGGGGGSPRAPPRGTLVVPGPDLGGGRRGRGQPCARREDFEELAGGLAGKALTEEDVAALPGFEVIEVWFPDLRGLLTSEEAPVLVMYSSLDKLIRASVVEEYVRSHARPGQARAVRFDGSHHVRHFERHRERYTAELDSFLESLR